MKPWGRFFKLLAVYGVGLFVFLSAGRVVFSSLVDWSKHEEWRCQKMQELLDEVKKTGSAKYTVLSFRDFDANKDGSIDKSESKTVEEELQKSKAAELKTKKP